MRRLEILLLGLLMIGEFSTPPSLSSYESDEWIQIRSGGVNMDAMYDYTRIPPLWVDAVIWVPYSNRRWTFVLLCDWKTEWCRFRTSPFPLLAHAYPFLIITHTVALPPLRIPIRIRARSPPLPLPLHLRNHYSPLILILISLPHFLHIPSNPTNNPNLPPNHPLPNSRPLPTYPIPPSTVYVP